MIKTPIIMCIFRKWWIVILFLVIDAASIPAGKPEMRQQHAHLKSRDHVHQSIANVPGVETKQNADPETHTLVPTPAPEGLNEVDIALIVLGCLAFLLAIVWATYMQQSVAKKIRSQYKVEHILHETKHFQHGPKVVHV